MFVKHCKVEVYLLELNLCENDNMENVVTRHFSKADTIGERLLESTWIQHVNNLMTGFIHTEHFDCYPFLFMQCISPPFFRYYRERDEDTVQYPIREGDKAVEQIHEQHL